MGNFIIRAAWLILIITFLFWEVNETTVFEQGVKFTIGFFNAGS